MVTECCTPNGRAYKKLTVKGDSKWRLFRPMQMNYNFSNVMRARLGVDRLRYSIYYEATRLFDATVDCKVRKGHKITFLQPQHYDFWPFSEQEIEIEQRNGGHTFYRLCVFDVLNKHALTRVWTHMHITSKKCDSCTFSEKNITSDHCYHITLRNIVLNVIKQLSDIVT